MACPEILSHRFTLNGLFIGILLQKLLIFLVPPLWLLSVPWPLRCQENNNTNTNSTLFQCEHISRWSFAMAPCIIFSILVPLLFQAFGLAKLYQRVPSIVSEKRYFFISAWNGSIQFVLVNLLAIIYYTREWQITCSETSPGALLLIITQTILTPYFIIPFLLADLYTIYQIATVQPFKLIEEGSDEEREK